jgi:hypothetical protein
MRRILAALAVAVPMTDAALADRPVTEEERAKLVELLAAEGCSGGTMEFDDDEYEVDDAECADGHKWDFEFDRNFKLIEKERED